MINIKTKSIGIIRPFRISVISKLNKSSMIKTQSYRMQTVDMFFRRLNEPTISFQSYNLNKLIKAAYSFHLPQFFTSSFTKNHIKQNHIKSSHGHIQNHMKLNHDHYSHKIYQNTIQPTITRIFNNLKQNQTSAKVPLITNTSISSLHHNITNLKQLMSGSKSNFYSDKKILGKTSYKTRNRHDLVFISQREKVKNSHNQLHKVLPVEIIYRQAAQVKDVPSVPTQQQISNNTMPKLDISKLSNEVIRRINKQVRIERERQGRL